MTTTPPMSAAPGAVILVDDTDGGWKGELEALLRRYGYRIARIRELAMAPYLLISGGVTALIFEDRRLGAKDLMALDRVRRLAPSLAIIVVAGDSGQAALRRAFDQGATTFLSWPTADAVLLDVLRRGPGDVPSAKGDTGLAPEVVST